MQSVAVQAPLFVVVVAAAHDELLGHPARRRVQDVGLAAGDPQRRQHGHMSVTALFAQQCDGVPQLGHGFVGPVQRQVGREQRSTVQCSAAGHFGRQVRGGAHIVVVADAVAAQRGHRRFLASTQRVGRRGELPCRGQCLRDAFRREVVERGRHHLRRYDAERRRTGREVAHPETAEPEPVECGAGLRREIGHGVHRFETVEEAARESGLPVHFRS